MLPANGTYSQKSNPLARDASAVKALVPFELNETGLVVTFWEVPEGFVSGTGQHPSGSGRRITPAESAEDEIRGDNNVEEVWFGDFPIRKGRCVCAYFVNESTVAEKTGKATMFVEEE